MEREKLDASGLNESEAKMNESEEREAYRMRCKRYSEVSGHCRERSGSCMPLYGFPYAPNTAWIDINCTPGCGCARMKRFDKRTKTK